MAFGVFPRLNDLTNLIFDADANLVRLPVFVSTQQ
jgi:hypothetical protein